MRRSTRLAPPRPARLRSSAPPPPRSSSATRRPRAAIRRIRASHMQRADIAPVSPAKASAPPLTPPPGGRRRCRPQKEEEMRKPPILGALTLFAPAPALLPAPPPPAQPVTPPATRSAPVCNPVTHAHLLCCTLL